MNDNNHYQSLSCESWSDLPAGLKVLKDTILKDVIPYQNQLNKPWEIIRFEIWEDTGRVIAFPANRPLLDRTDVAGAQLICQVIADSVSELDASDLPDAQHEVEITKIVGRLANEITKTIQQGEFFKYGIYDQYGNEIQI